jgi:hypothetical protein
MCALPGGTEVPPRNAFDNAVMDRAIARVMDPATGEALACVVLFVRLS